MVDQLTTPNFISGANIIRFANHVEIPPGGEYKAEYDLGEACRKDDSFQAWRGQIINNSLFIEERIEIIICKLLFKKEFGSAELFKSVILSREFFGFMNKWKVLKDLLKIMDPFREKNYSSLFKDLHEIIDERDKFAHGQVMYSGNKGEKIILEYFKDSLKKEQVSEDTLKIFLEKCSKCYHELDKIEVEAQKRQGISDN